MARALLIAGLGFGDEGKGTVTDFLARRHQGDSTLVIIRYNGGAQAAHNVVTPDGWHHTFSQFGSGTFVPGCRTHLSRFMMVNPITMQAEERHLREVGVTDAFDRTTVEDTALVTTPIHMAANRLREMFRDRRHGSCGMGIGETMSDSLEYGDSVLRVKDLTDEKTLRRKLEWLLGVKWEDVQQLHHSRSVGWQETEGFREEWRLLGQHNLIDRIVDHFREWRESVTIVGADYLGGLLHGKEGTAIFEGAQGVLLDEHYGFHPHTTWSTTTFKNADELLRGIDVDVTKIGVLRAYHTRHGAGPFPTESVAMARELPDLHNSSGHAYQQSFRVGPFDAMMLRYALHVTGPVDEIAMTHLDRVPSRVSVCTRYQKGRSKFDELRPHTAGTTQGQEELGRALSSMRPEYETCHDIDAFLRYVEGEARCPIRITSYGPRATDKRVR